jgi:hypothetical protein
MWTEDNIIVPKEIIESSKKNFISARCMEACAIIESKTFFQNGILFLRFGIISCPIGLRKCSTVINFN